MKTDANSQSQCPVGKEQWEYFTTPVLGKERRYVQYDYRNVDGDLFTGVFASLGRARQKRDEWIMKRETKEQAMGVL